MGQQKIALKKNDHIELSKSFFFWRRVK